jgi:hypothetical protein
MNGFGCSDSVSSSRFTSLPNEANNAPKDTARRDLMNAVQGWEDNWENQIRGICAMKPRPCTLLPMCAPTKEGITLALRYDSKKVTIRCNNEGSF